MRIEFDPAKNKANIRERGLDFELAADFDFDSAFIQQAIDWDVESAPKSFTFFAVLILLFEKH